MSLPSLRACDLSSLWRFFQGGRFFRGGLLCLLATCVFGCLPGMRDNAPEPDVPQSDGAADSQVDSAVDGAAFDTDANPGSDSADASLPQDQSAATDGDLDVDPAALGCTDDVSCLALPMPPCTTAACNKKTGLCEAKKATDGAACSDDCLTTPACKAGVCAGAAKVCDDSNPCTDDTCSTPGGCSFAPNSALCNDKVNCTLGDHCEAGECAGTPRLCKDDNPCTIGEACNEKSGECNALPADVTVVCDEGKPCTGPGHCKGSAAVCVGKNLCDDANACTSDLCNKGQCLHLSKTVGDACGDGDDKCTSKFVCAADATGKLSCQTKAYCDDGKPCTVDSCGKGGACSNVNVGIDSACDDGKPCTAGEVCLANGDCKPKANQKTVCNDGNPCTDDVCQTDLGCVAKPNTAACSDGNGCTSGDACKDGKCGGSALACDDGNPCTTDTCDPLAGCKHAAVQGGTVCPGGTCDLGACKAKP